VIRALAAAAVLALSAPAVAAGQTPVILGDGEHPGVTIDASGTAYITWIGREPNITSLHFCRLPRGAAACAVNQALTVPNTSLYRPYTVVDGATVRILSSRYQTTTGDPPNGIYMLTSNDGGTTFGPAERIGTLTFYDAVRAPGGGVSLMADNSSTFQHVPLQAGPVTATAPLSTSHLYSPTIAFVDATTRLAVFANGNGLGQFRRHLGSGDPNDVATWEPAQDIGATTSYPRLASGPSGTFLMSDNENYLQEVRRFGVGGFGPPVQPPGVNHEAGGGSHDMTQDPGGRLHLIYPYGDGSGIHVGYAVSDDGVSWRAGSFDVGNPNDVNSGASDMRVAVAADHVGVAVYRNSEANNQVRAIAIGPEPPAAPVPPQPTPTPEPAPPTPSLGEAVTAQAVKGTVQVKLPGAKGYVPLTTLSSVPVGSTLDTRKGTVRLNSAVKGGGVQTGDFYDGQFVVKQATSVDTTDLVLSGGSFKSCPRARRAGATAAAKRNRTVRRLWGNAKGRFRTSGKYSAATVRGTVWLVADRCDGTLTQVKSGVVSVRDKRRRKTVLVKARRSYLARARR
jgi:hypothetical protein